MRELWIDLHFGSSRALYEQIYDEIRTLIADGKLFPGEKLPSTRFMAKNLSVSRSTVELAYEQLAAEGYIESRPCAGYFVCDISALYQLRRDTAEPERPEEQKEETGCRLHFSPFEIDREKFPYGIWHKVTKSIQLSDTPELLLSGEAQGDPALRSAICRYLCRARGVVCREEQIVLGAGNEYLLLLLSQILGSRRSVMMEQYTYLQAYQTFSNMGYTVYAGGVDEGGIVMEDVRRREPELVYVMPSHQFPLGYVMPLKRRLELLSWASEGEERYILEDDHDSEFRYKGKPIPALWGNDTGEHVIYLGTFSKSIAPSLRISFMVLPEHLLGSYRERCGFYSCTVPRMIQAVLCRFLEEGHFERHMNRMRNVYKNKHDTLLRLLRQENWIRRIYGEYAGLHVLAEPVEGITEEELVRRAQEAGLEIHGLSEYRIGEQTGDGQRTGMEPETAEGKTTGGAILLGYGNLTEEEMREGIAILRSAAHAESMVRMCEG